MTDEASSLLIRRATVADAEALAALSSRAFVETFGHLYPDEDLQYFLQLSYAVEEQRRLLADPAYGAWLLQAHGGSVDDGVLLDDGANVALGYAVAGPCGLPHIEARPDDGELKRLYVLKAAQNGGWGGRLFQAALDWLEQGGARPLWIGVWSENVGAQRFYARHGFTQVGSYEFPVGRVRDHELILRRLPRVGA